MTWWLLLLLYLYPSWTLILFHLVCTLIKQLLSIAFAKNPNGDKICKVSRAEARFIVHQNRLVIVIRSVSPSEITAVSLIQLDRLSREERSSGSVTLISHGRSRMMSRFYTENRGPPSRVDRLSKDDRTIWRKCSRDFSQSGEKSIGRKTSPASLSRGVGRADVLRIVNNCSSWQ